MSTVWVKHAFVGWHNWPSAPPRRRYLADSHRHLFHVLAEIDVLHDDRELEFHDLLDVVRDTCATLGRPVDSGRDLGPMSCETIARYVAEAVTTAWPNRPLSITVSEDDECGATFSTL